MADAVIFGGYSGVWFATKPAGAHVIANTFRDMGMTAVVVDHVFAISMYSPYWMSEIIKKFVDKDTKFICLSTTLLGAPGVGVSSMIECDDLFEPIMNEIKTIAPHAVFVVGGPFMAMEQETRLPFDYKVRGQGEVCIRAIAAKVISGHEITLDADGYVSDKIYDYGTFNKDASLIFTTDDAILENETLPIEFARGCVFKCAYCDYALTGKNFGDFNKSEEVMYATLMSNYEKFGTTNYVASDDTLNDSEEKVDQLLKVSKRLPFQLQFGAYLRAELLEKHPDMAAKLLDAGLRGANIGIETLNKKAGSTVGKGYGMKAVDTLLKARKTWNGAVAVNINLILGLPYDTVEDLRIQHDIFLNNDLCDFPFYSRLGIPRRNKGTGASLFSEGGWEKYYKEMDPTGPKYAQLLEHYKGNAFELYWLNRSIVWERKDDGFDYLDALLLMNELNEAWEENRDRLINHLGAFSAVQLLSDFSMEELREYPVDNWLNGVPDGTEGAIPHSIKRVVEYRKLLMSDKISVPSTTTPLYLDPVPPTYMPFQSKIKIHVAKD